MNFVGGQASRQTEPICQKMREQKERTMKKLEVFFDYNCPYCLKGYHNLIEFLANKPDVDVVWRPCEIYERPKHYSGMMHTDICIQAMFFAAENGIDLFDFYKKMGELIFEKRVNVENIDTLSDAFEGYLDVEALRQALKSGKYSKELKDANHYALNVRGVKIVPSYSADGGELQDRQEFFGLPY